MGYQEIAARQRGFLLRSQLTEEEIQDMHDTGFIIEAYSTSPNMTSLCK